MTDQALVSAQKVQTVSSSPLPADLEHFRAWLQENNPLSSAESKFLDDEGDLLSLKAAALSPGTPKSPLDFLPLCILMTTVFPLLCFKFITGVLNRLILLTVLLAAGLGSLEKLDRSKVDQHQQWLIACFGVSLLVAVFF